ncbi:hypothetical protein ABPG72_018992 [Tetrahymena utriculariae]
MNQNSYFEDLDFDKIYQQLLAYIDNQQQLQRIEILNLHILICDLTIQDIQSIIDQIHSYKIIKNLKLSLRFFKSRKQQNQFIQILAKIIFKICKIEHIIINKQAQTITIENLIPFLKEAQNHIELNQLTVNFNYLNEQFENEINYNLMLFSQELGYLSQVKKLNFQMDNFVLNQQYALGIFQGFRDCKHVEKLNLKILIEDVEIKVFEYIKDEISKLNNLREFKIKMSIAEEYLKQIQKVILDLMISLKLLEVFSINILIKQTKDINAIQQPQLEENLIVSNGIQKLTVNIKNKQRKENNISFSRFDNQIFFGSSNLQQISWDLTNCSEKNVEHFCSLLDNNANLNSIKLKVGKNKHFNNVCASVERVQLLEKLKIQIDQDYIRQIEDVQEVSKLFKHCKSLKDLKLDFLKCVVNCEILNEFSLQIGSCLQLQTLVFNIGINATQKIDQDQFFKNLQKNKYLTYLFFNFNIHKKKSSHKIEIKNQPRHFCGTIYLVVSQQQHTVQQQLKQFQKIVNLKCKKFKRLVKFECVCDRLYQCYGNENYQNYRFLSINEENEDYF